jgi:hypothetical protein
MGTLAGLCSLPSAPVYAVLRRDRPAGNDQILMTNDEFQVLWVRWLQVGRCGWSLSSDTAAAHCLRSGNPCKALGIKVRWASLGFVGPKSLENYETWQSPIPQWRDGQADRNPFIRLNPTESDRSIFMRAASASAYARLRRDERASKLNLQIKVNQGTGAGLSAGQFLQTSWRLVTSAPTSYGTGCPAVGKALGINGR